MTGTPILSSRGRHGEIAIHARSQPRHCNAGLSTEKSCAVQGESRVANGPRELKPGALIIAAHYAGVLNRSCHERSSQDVLPSVRRDQTWGHGTTANAASVAHGKSKKSKIGFPISAGDATTARSSTQTSGVSGITSIAMTAQAFAHTPLSRDNKTGPGTQSGAAHPGPHAPGEGASEFVSRGEPCLDYLASELAKHAKSADIFQHQRTELSKSPSGASQRSSGPTTPRLGSRHSPSVMCEQPAAGFQARSTRPPMSGPSCSPLRLIQTDLCGND
jgi:hypothetical protein